MNKFWMSIGVGASLLLSMASAGWAGPNVGGAPLGAHGRELADERAEQRRSEPRPYVLTGEGRETSWQMEVKRNPSGRVRSPSFKREPAAGTTAP